MSKYNFIDMEKEYPKSIKPILDEIKRNPEFRAHLQRFVDAMDEAIEEGEGKLKEAAPKLSDQEFFNHLDVLSKAIEEGKGNA